MKNIPVLTVCGDTLAEAYELALRKLYAEGGRKPTQYDKPGDPQSIDATMNITVLDPLKDPMIHKAFPGGIADLREYVMELEGAKDHWVKNINDKNDTRWEYTYHGRLANWGLWKEKRMEHKADGMLSNDDDREFVNVSIGQGHYDINQINAVIEKLAKQPFTRQAQMITWMPMLDLDCYDPPCLQSVWLRVCEEDGVWYLNYNIRFRSNDAWGAYFMNSFGLTMFLQHCIADPLALKAGKEVRLARMNWQADSWHVYGKDIAQFKARLIDRLNEPFESRVYNFRDPDIQDMYNEAKEEIDKKIADESKNMKEKYG